MRNREPMATRAALPATLALAGCLPSAMLEPAELVQQDCRGLFTAEVGVVRSGGRKLDVVYEFTPGEFNVAELARTPERETIKGKPGRSKVNVNGRVVDACADAGLHLFASYVPGGHALFVSVPSVVEASPGIETPQSDPSDGAFVYPIELTCCGADRSGPYEVRVRGLDNVARVSAAPGKVDCVGTEQHAVSIEGTVAAPGERARVEIEIESGDDGRTCTIDDELVPG